MKNCMMYLSLAIILICGTVWLCDMVKAERELKVVTWPITETSEVKPWQQDLMSERALQLDNQEDAIEIWGSNGPSLPFIWENGTLAPLPIDTTTTDPNFIWTTGGDIEFDWSLCITNDVVVNTESGCEITINKVADKWVVAGDPNCYGDVIAALIESYFQQQESYEFWRKTNQRITREALDLAKEIVKDAKKYLEDAKKLLEAKCQHKEQIIEIASEIAFDVVMEIGDNIKRELAVTE